MAFVRAIRSVRFFGPCSGLSITKSLAAPSCASGLLGSGLGVVGLGFGAANADSVAGAYLHIRWSAGVCLGTIRSILSATVMFEPSLREERGAKFKFEVTTGLPWTSPSHRGAAIAKDLRADCPVSVGACISCFFVQSEWTVAGVIDANWYWQLFHRRPLQLLSHRAAPSPLTD